MEMTRKAMASGLLVTLLLVGSGLAPSVLGSGDCWVDDRVHYVMCLKTAICRNTCQLHGYVDGRCQWGFPNLVPFCQCLRFGPGCPPRATGASD
ncbi:hypothetical protein BAE44_0026407 [Dichanthelium oligosanthes]|uniref:Knottin scorpion toxin-like domain-containing protein n=1 Tax=Dichanthelium oligosanthes TaxID=888268 RepID=A0A1E5UI75_9POAL|nr:hypothetical protein BAE44_0026407 [Dichanthelium oligosanthes]